MTGTKRSRPELDRLLDKLRSGDTVVIESLSRLGRSTKDLLALVEHFEKQDVVLISLKESIDISTPTGKLLVTVLSALCQFERDLTVQRTNEGLTAARARGRKGGRPPKDAKTVEKALKLYKAQTHSVAEICELCRIGTGNAIQSNPRATGTGEPYFRRRKIPMKEHEFKCKKCGNTWYATDKDIRESRKQQSNIQRAKLQNASGFRGKKYTKRRCRNRTNAETQSNQDPYRCSGCGSRDVEIVGSTERNESSGVSLGQKLLIALAVVFLPFIAIIFLHSGRSLFPLVLTEFALSIVQL